MFLTRPQCKTPKIKNTKPADSCKVTPNNVFFWLVLTLLDSFIFLTKNKKGKKICFLTVNV